MGEAAEGAGGRTDGDRDLAAVSQARGALRLAWGDVYMFGHDEKGYWAAQADAPGTGIHRANNPEELGRLLTDFGPGPS